MGVVGKKERQRGTLDDRSQPHDGRLTTIGLAHYDEGRNSHASYSAFRNPQSALSSHTNTFTSLPGTTMTFFGGLLFMNSFTLASASAAASISLSDVPAASVSLLLTLPF